MNLFEYIKNYRDPKSFQSYGDILENNTMANNLSPIEHAIYEQFKNSDRARLINSGRLQ